jgi:hypothetical protein
MEMAVEWDTIEDDSGVCGALKADSDSPAAIRGFADLTEAVDVSLRCHTVNNQ